MKKRRVRVKKRDVEIKNISTNKSKEENNKIEIQIIIERIRLKNKDRVSNESKSQYLKVLYPKEETIYRNKPMQISKNS